MKSLHRNIVIPAFLGLLIAIFAFGILPIPGTHAISVVGHPNDIFADIYRDTSPSVVAISVITEEGGGSGSGFVIDREGHIVTNAHVVDDADEIAIEFFDGGIYRAELTGADPASDIAVVKVDVPAGKLKQIPFADSDQLIVGQTVLAIGSPFRQGWTLTSGIISALDRTIQSLTQFQIGGVIQTDASINPGNSGGPLINLDGEVIGVNSQIISGSRSSSGVGFAVPSNLTRRVAEALIEDGEMTYSYIGITGEDVGLSVIETLDLPNDFGGVLVGEVLDDGPAAATDLHEIAEMRTRGNGELVGIRVDIITAIDGTSIKGMDDLITYLVRHTRPEQEVVLTVHRDGEREVEIPIVLGSR